MNYSGDLAIALEQLKMANEAYHEAANALKDRQKTRTECAEAFRKFREKSSDIYHGRRILDEALLAEKATEEYMRKSMQEVRAKQSAYDKLKHLAVLEKKSQKESEARAKKEREQSEKKEQSEKQEKQEESEEQKKKKNKKTRQSEGPGSEKRFWKDDYQEPPPKANVPKDKPRRIWQKPQWPRNPETPMPPSAWKLACDTALSDRSTMTSFPDPPYFSCTDKGCGLTRNQRALKACKCNIAEALQRDPGYPESLKTERLRWHPDKFSVCLEEHRLMFQAKAKEIFVVANHLYERDG